MFDINGLFEYGPISAEIFALQDLVNMMDDEELVNNIMELPYSSFEIELITMTFIFNNLPLSPDERYELEAFYVLACCSDGVEVERVVDVG